MDFVHPVEAVIPGAQGRILSVLVEASAELNLRTIARLSGVSVAQVARVLPMLVDLGLVERREAPPSLLFRFVEDNVGSRAILALRNARATALDDLAGAAAWVVPAPVSVVVFGSFARGEADEVSDLDVLVVRNARVGEANEQWSASLDEFRSRARRLTGNVVNLMEVDASKVRALLRGRKPLWSAIASEGVVVHGKSVSSLRGDRVA